MELLCCAGSRLLVSWLTPFLSSIYLLLLSVSGAEIGTETRHLENLHLATCFGPLLKNLTFHEEADSPAVLNNFNKSFTCLEKQLRGGEGLIFSVTLNQLTYGK